MPERCGSLHDHKDGEVRGCVLDRGHGGQHISADRVRWERGNYSPEVRLGIGVSMPFLDSPQFNCGDD